MKKIVFVFFFTMYSFITLASHITGGEMLYQYVGLGSKPNTKLYRITLKLFRDQNTTGAPMPTSVFIGIFNNDNNMQFPSFDVPYTVPISDEEPVSVDPFPPCVKNASELNYHVGYFTTTVPIELPDNIKGYTATYQTCCRVNPLNNVYAAPGTGGTGSSYTCVIPPIPDSSPAFAGSIDLICQNRDFTLNFSATDEDDDSLIYSFADAYDGGAALNANNINPAPPPYIPVTYLSGFSGNTPLGGQAIINRFTGVISGIAPVTGKYVVSVRVMSYKNGKYIGEHRKDFIVNVGDCDVPGASLDPKPVTCDGYSVGFSNNNPSVLNKTFFWDFGDPASGPLNNTSTSATPTHLFSDTGVFIYKLVVNKGQQCSDSTTQAVKIYPGFFPGFTSIGQCKNTPIQFKDTTKSRYGIVNSWSWNFGDQQRTDDTSHLKNPTYSFTPSDNYKVQLIVSDNNGCTDTAIVTIAIKDKPDFTVTHDTLIFLLDAQLQH
jgi:hypothetical protein